MRHLSVPSCREIAEEITGENVTSYVGPSLISKITSSGREIYHPDGIGSTRGMTDSSQAVQTAVLYDAWGNLLAAYPDGEEFGYVGQYRYYADETGLDYLKARYYDPAIGRFVSRDPIGYEGGINLYAYVGNDPTNFTDASGLNADHYSCSNCMWLINWYNSWKGNYPWDKKRPPKLGPRQDKVGHCFVTCKAIKDCGFTRDDALKIGKAKECLDSIRKGGRDADDQEANTIGGDIALKPGSNCLPDCLEAVNKAIW